MAEAKRHRKRSAIDRLPTDYETTAPARKRPQVEHGGDWGAMLTLTPLTEEERAARAGRALDVMRALGAEDLAEALGLVDGPSRPRPPAPATSVPCPSCPAPSGQPCIAAKTGNVFNGGHKGRYRLAQEQAQGTAATRTQPGEPDAA